MLLRARLLNDSFTDVYHPHTAHSGMLQDLQKTHKQFRNLEALALVLGLIREEYGSKVGSNKGVFADSLVLLSFVEMTGSMPRWSRRSPCYCLGILSTCVL